MLEELAICNWHRKDHAPSNPSLRALYLSEEVHYVASGKRNAAETIDLHYAMLSSFSASLFIRGVEQAVVLATGARTFVCAVRRDSV